MSSQARRAIFAAMIMILASLAGCIGSDDIASDDGTESLGTVIASTYHVEQLASAVGGDLVSVEMMSTMNIPVHDYEPSATDLIRLNQADVFFYHGLGLEPWVDGALANMDSNGPVAVQTHAMPSGETTLDFESLLIDNLCTSMTGPATTDVHVLADHPREAAELHSDDGGHNMAFPAHNESHDETHDENETEHNHAEHDEVSPEETITNPEGCATGTAINVYHFEAGEYMLEFESESQDPFRMAIAAMGGAHHHHHHGHGDGAFEWAGIFDMTGDTHTWSMQKVDGSYADQTMKLVLIPTESTAEATMHELESGVEALMDGDCTVVEDGETMTPIMADGSCFDLHVGNGDDSTFTMNTAGISGLAIYAQHVPIEFERDQHYLKDAAGEDVEPNAEEGAEGHAHAHGDEEEAEEEEEGVCHDETTHQDNTNYTTKEDCEAAGHHWDDGWNDEYEEGAAFVGLHVEEEGDYGIALPAGVAVHVLETGHDDHDHGDEHGDGFEWAGVFEMSDSTHTWSMQKVDGDYADPSMWLVLIPTDTPTESTMHDLESGVDALVDAGCTVVEDGESMSSIAAEGSCFELHVGAGDDSTYTIDTTGITGMAMYAQHVPTEFERDQHYLKDSAGTDIEPVAQEGAGAHDHGHGNEEIAFDPHSWLDPVAFAAQVEVVVSTLSTTFPEGAETFRANADEYKAQLMSLDESFSTALSEAGTCTTDTVAANHNAYAYISQRYGVEFVTLHGLDPEGEPSPETVAEVLERVEEDGITAIYVEEFSPNGALDSLIQQTMSDDLPNGLAILTLYTMEMAPSEASGDDYLSLMGKNLENLKTGLGC